VTSPVSLVRNVRSSFPIPNNEEPSILHSFSHASLCSPTGVLAICDAQLAEVLSMCVMRQPLKPTKRTPLGRPILLGLPVWVFGLLQVLTNNLKAWALPSIYKYPLVRLFYRLKFVQFCGFSDYLNPKVYLKKRLRRTLTSW
jgi:hypothetical protein